MSTLTGGELGPSDILWGHEAPRYEGAADDTGLDAPDEALERDLFNLEERPTKGVHFSSYDQVVDIKVIEPETGLVQAVSTFDEAPLHSAMAKNLQLCGWSNPTPVQKYAIPTILRGYDFLSIAQTGSGKTAAFLVPIISRLMGRAGRLRQPRSLDISDIKEVQPLVLIIAPTRELVIQIFDDARRLCYRSMLRPCALYGGVSSRLQYSVMRHGCDVLVATPGRLYEFLSHNYVNLNRLKHIVLDEADRLLETEAPALKGLLANSETAGGDEVQISMFSATFPGALKELAAEHLADQFVSVQVGNDCHTSEEIKQNVEYVENEDKLQKLKDLLYELPPSRTLVFVNTKRLCDYVDDKLHNWNFPVTSIHAGRTQREREDALLSFRCGRTPVLVATDVAARGLDIRSVMHVINYELPDNINDYIHRIGRTARIGNSGLATTFYNTDAEALASDLIRILRDHQQDVPEFLAKCEDFEE